MKRLTCKTKGIITIVASIGISLYSIYEIIRVISITLDPSQFILKPFVQRVLFFLNTSIYDWGLLALGLCGLVFVYADLNHDKDMDVQNRITKIKKIVFYSFLIFSVGYIFRFMNLLYTSYQSYEIAKDAGSAVEYFGIPLIAIIIIGAVFSLFIISGRILFGVYLVSKNAKILKPFLILFFVGCAYTLIINVYKLVNGCIQYTIASELYINNGLVQPSRFSMIWPHVTDILIMIASAIVILYGIKKEKETI